MRLLNLAAAFAAALLGAAGAQAQDRAVPQSRAQVQLSYAAVVKEAAPSVVNVYGARVERRQQNAAMEEFMRRFFGDGGPAAPAARERRTASRAAASARSAPASSSTPTGSS